MITIQATDVIQLISQLKLFYEKEEEEEVF